jgi:triosephosphate isomerase
MKKKLIAANWKMHKTPGETKEFFQALGPLLQTLEKNSTAAVDNIEVLVCPPALCLMAAIEAKSTLQSLLVNSKIAGQIHIGAQNVYAEAKGAFTGENSAEVAKSMGASYALVGHSERRTLFGEGKDLLNKKMKYLQSLGLNTVL